MIYQTLISAQTLHAHLNQPDWVIIDCRFSLANAEAGLQSYQQGHLPNARYAHLNDDLSSPITEKTGRHPLPDFEWLIKKLGDWGVDNATQVIVYDDAAGAFAGRLWWLLRCLGHQAVAVLDGGIKQWQALGYEVTTDLPSLEPKTFAGDVNRALWLDTQQVATAISAQSILLVDARTPERYRGEHEPIDPIAGHIPTALNRPFQHNLNEHGLFLSPDVLRAQFNELINSTPVENVVHYCGSGVTACHNLLAMEYAGLNGSRLYAGSWSEWITEPSRLMMIED